jgi:hypothetical protein
MRSLLDRVCLALLLLSACYVGGWAYLAPYHWYAHFPGFGLRWLPQLGPYNEHLAKDVGAMYLALAVLTLVALARPRDRASTRIAGATWLVFNVLHLAYHTTMLGRYGPTDRVLNVVTLSLVVLLAVPLVVRPSAEDRVQGGRDPVQVERVDR